MSGVMKNVKEIQEKFETYVVSIWPQAEGNFEFDGESYDNHFINYIWLGWKGCRENTTVVLPYYESLVIYYDTLGVGRYVEDAKEQLEEQGFSVEFK